jgi:hypothetical protein
MGSGVMLIEPNAIKPEAVHFRPGLKVLLEGARADLGVKSVTRQRIGQELRGFGILEVGAVGDEIEQKNLHGKGALTGVLRRMCQAVQRFVKRARRNADMRFAAGRKCACKFVAKNWA